MKLEHINKIRANITIYSTKRTSNLLDGTYKSVYKGKSLNFENLREYVINDDIKDIDWKSSARCNKLLVKQFIAEKKHNIMIIIDSGTKMNADTDKKENKKVLATYVAGTIGYIAIKNGDYVGISYHDNSIIYKPFKDNLYNLEEYLSSYEISNGMGKLNTTIEYIYKNINKKMIIFVITDLNGLNNIDENLIKKVKLKHDMMFINIKDNFMFGNNIYDVENETYIPKYLLEDQKLPIVEKQLKDQIYNQCLNKLNRYKISLVEISTIKQINDSIIKLLQEHAYASRH